MTTNGDLSIASYLMEEFANSTGIEGDNATARRYLWTDAFAVCNFLELFKRTKNERYLKLAINIVDQVHTVLGRHRKDDSRSGWISGLDEQEGALHPTQGGLRIGKELNERRQSEPFDQHLEWERDGQYFHYLTKWMHALSCMSRVTKNQAYLLWAVELAKSVHEKFSYRPPMKTSKRMYWKMSIDLSYPLISSMGQHDPLDGLLTYLELQSVRTEEIPSLAHEIDDIAKICEAGAWATNDPLGLGCLLVGAYTAAEFCVRGAWREPELLTSILESCAVGLASPGWHHYSSQPAHFRLAFRELGLAIGFEALAKLSALSASEPSLREVCGNQLSLLEQCQPLGSEIIDFWLNQEHRDNPTWKEHNDINSVMLATALIPATYLSTF